MSFTNESSVLLPVIIHFSAVRTFALPVVNPVYQVMEAASLSMSAVLVLHEPFVCNFMHLLYCMYEISCIFASSSSYFADTFYELNMNKSKQLFS